MNNWNIEQIEALTEDEAKKMALETMEIKRHTIYLVDFKGYFGYSRLVFLNGKHIKYADDYQLHHEYTVKEKGIDGLRELLISSANNILFTEEELVGPIKDYDDYDRKAYYLHNYYGLQKDYISAFQIIRNEQDEKEFRRKVKDMTYNPISFSYMQDKEFVKHHIELKKKLEEQKEKKADNYEYYKKAFLSEMYNHEYSINWQADYDTLSAFGNIEWHENDINAYFKELEFTEVQKRAYIDARAEYYRQIDEEIENCG